MIYACDDWMIHVLLFPHQRRSEGERGGHIQRAAGGEGHVEADGDGGGDEGGMRKYGGINSWIDSKDRKSEREAVGFVLVWSVTVVT